MLTNEGINRMLKVFKPLTKLEVLNSSLIKLGQTNVIWNEPINSIIKTQPFTVVTQIGDVSWFRLDNVVINATTILSYDDKNSQPPSNIPYMPYFMDIALTAFDNDKVGTKVAEGFEVEGKKYSFRVFITGIGRNEMYNVGLAADKLTGGNLVVDDVMNKSNLDRLETFMYRGLSDPGVLLVDVDYAGGDARWLLVPTVNTYTIDDKATNLQYILSNYTSADLDITEETLLRIPNGISETLVKGNG